LVRIVVASACLPVIRSLAIYVSKLGNGGIYLILPIIVLMRLGRSGLPAIFVAFCSVTLLHCFYPYISDEFDARALFKRIDRYLACLRFLMNTRFQAATR